MFGHTLLTWLVANLIHPIFFLSGIYFFEPGADSMHGTVHLFFLVFFYSLALSTPCLLVAWLILFLLNASPLVPASKFFVWLFAAPSSILLEVYIVMLIFQLDDPYMLIYTMPAMVATGLAILIRCRQFFKLINKTDHETNLV